ncbi:hypothetical protein C8J57DRAFT_1235550 [Mycena rebaudengoi]|nr:hypothetical protein C8J57DRAFT_1235550 [Mycena rebaudengoi]
MAQHISQLIGDKHTRINALRVESECQAGVGKLLHAEKLCREAPEQYALEEYLPDILLTKTEYLEARTPLLDTVECHLNLAIIAIEMGADVGVINHHLDAVRMQCTTFVVYPRGILRCDPLTSNRHLRQGNIQLARQTIEKCLTSAQKDTDADIIAHCLLFLADIQHGLSSYRETERWAVISLAFGMTTKNKVTTTKALLCIGDLLVIDRDDGAALSSFMAALASFMFMDIHRARADCMVRMAAIFEWRGEIRKTVHLLERARPLYARSSQEKDMIKIDTKLRGMAAVRKDDENPLQQLAQLNFPVGDVKGTEVTELDVDSANAERDCDMIGEDMEGVCVHSIHAT